MEVLYQDILFQDKKDYCYVRKRLRILLTMFALVLRVFSRLLRVFSRLLRVHSRLLRVLLVWEFSKWKCVYMYTSDLSGNRCIVRLCIIDGT
jgi:hypothetical protein